jgi:hypothetical protein
MKLYDEHLTVDHTPEGVILEPSFCGYLRMHGYPVNGLTDIHTVHSESSEKAYLVCKIETLALPEGHPDLDIVTDDCTIPVCSCDGFRYHASVDLSGPNKHPPDTGTCKHIQRAFKTIRAEQDDNQRTL